MLNLKYIFNKETKIFRYYHSIAGRPGVVPENGNARFCGLVELSYVFVFD